MNKFLEFCFVLALACFISCVVSGCISSFHAEKIDWKTGENIEYENNND